MRCSHSFFTHSLVAVVVNVTTGTLALPDVPSLSLVSAEAYALRLRVVDATLVATVSTYTPTGVLRALATLLQLLVTRNAVAFLPIDIDIVDAPARPWRGLMIDVARRYHAVESLARTLDAMEFAKLNVLHLHLTDDQGVCVRKLNFSCLYCSKYGRC